MQSIICTNSCTQEEKLQMESDLEKEISRLKSAQAALKKAISDKRQQMSVERAVLQQEAELLDADPPVKLCDSKTTLLVGTFRNEIFKESGNDADLSVSDQ